MEEFLALLAAEPGRLSKYRAQPETWRAPLTAPDPPAVLPPVPESLKRRGVRALPPPRGTEPSATPAAKNGGAALPLKLYQPGHQRHYLVSACLVCRLPGLPDRALETARQESASFVVRRLMPPPEAKAQATPDATWLEYAFVGDGRTAAWEKVVTTGVPNAGVLVAGEELLPFFDVSFEQADRRSRRLFAGVVPVGRREEYLGAQEKGQAPAPPPGAQRLLDDPRTVLFMTQVSEPWKAVIRKAAQVAATLGTFTGNPPPDPVTAKENFVNTTRQDLQITSWYVLLDFARYLSEQLPVVWQTVKQEDTDRAPTPAETDLVNVLNTLTLTKLLGTDLSGDLKSGVSGSPVVPTSLMEALRTVSDPASGVEDKLERVTAPYDRTTPGTDWPTFLFPLADPTSSGMTEDQVDDIGLKIDAALPAEPTGPVPERRLALQPALSPATSWFVIRCVYARPLCGPLEPPVLSDPTEPFQMAAFFDPDAPARPVRIALPVDTSPAGLRKFDRNTAFMVSDVLCGQMKRFQGMTLGDLILAVLPWPLHKDLNVPDSGPCKQGGVQLGELCSISIPIITLCALIILMIIVSLLDLVFRWSAYFSLCFPYPKFTAKEGTS